MREIKFSAMTTPPKDFADYHFKSKRVYGTGIFFDGVNHWLYSHTISPMAHGFQEWIVKPETIGQYTGLKDKHDEEIYEDSDRVKVRIFRNEFHLTTPVREFISTISFSAHRGCLIFPEHYNISLADIREDVDEIYSLEIIGNIHENPELLNG